MKRSKKHTKYINKSNLENFSITEITPVIAIIISAISLIVIAYPVFKELFLDRPEYSIIMNDPRTWEEGDKILTISNEGDKKAENIRIDSRSFMIMAANDDPFHEETLSLPIYALDHGLKRTGYTSELIAYIEMTEEIAPLKNYNNLRYVEFSADLMEDLSITTRGMNLDRPDLEVAYSKIDLVSFTIISTNNEGSELGFGNLNEEDIEKIFLTDPYGTYEIKQEDFFSKYYNIEHFSTKKDSDPIKFWNNEGYEEDIREYFINEILDRAQQNS